MKTIITLISGILIFNFSIGQNIVYPDDCYYHNEKGGKVIDVTKPPFNAYNDGTHPDETTAALIAAYDTAKKEFTNMNIEQFIIYLPNGTYSVNNTVFYSGETQVTPGQHEVLNNVRIQGQSETGTIIKLTDLNRRFWNKSIPREVVSFGRGVQNNAVASNKFENITIDVGLGNPGVIGLRFHGANVASVRNVTIKSPDENKYGFVGLDMPIFVTQGIIKNVTIDGFDYGIRMTSDFATHPTFEYITCKNQIKAAFLMGAGSCSIRKFHSINNCPAIIMDEPEGHLVIIDSELEGGNSAIPAIDFRVGNLFARNIKAEGYRALIQENSKILYEDNILEGEYISGPILTLFNDTEKKSLNLPIEDTPQYEWEEDMSKWVSVNKFGAIPNDSLDDSKAIQKALNEGTSIVYFLPGEYVMATSVKIPAHVKEIYFMYSELRPAPPLQESFEGAFVIEHGKNPLVMQEFFVDWYTHSIHYWIDHASTRTLVLKNIICQRSGLYKNSIEGGKVFIETVHTNRNEKSKEKIDFQFFGQKVWCRDVDPEHTSGWEMLIDHSDVWILGYKTEFNQREKCEGVFKVVNGGNLEILGGLMNNYRSTIDEDIVYFLNDNSNISVVAREWGLDTKEAVFKTVVKEIQNGETRILKYTDTPRRGREKWNQIIPLYVGLKK